MVFGAFFGWLFGRLEGVLDNNKSFRTKNEILLGVIGGIIGNTFGRIFTSLMNINHYLITYIIFDFIVVALIYFLAMEIKKTKLKTYLGLDLFKLSPFMGVISIVTICVELSSSNSNMSPQGVLWIGSFFILFSVFVLWGIKKFFKNNNYFKNKYVFLLLYLIPILLILLEE